MIIYEGPSLLDDEPIVVIARPGTNIKTGWMLKIWIILRDVPPHKAAFDGRDVSICGTCRYRSDEDGNRACYVRTHLEPRTVWEAYRRGAYDSRGSDDDWQYGPTLGEWWHDEPMEESHWRYTGPLPVRIGAYGDPAAVPTIIWDQLVKHANRFTGYCHQWRTCDQALRRFCMASVDTPEEMYEARAMGWRTFHVVPHDVDYDPNREILCPASKEAGRKTTCDRCRLCMGNKVGGWVKPIWIPAHGPGKEFHTWND